MTSRAPSPDLELAHRLADLADAISMSRYRARDLVVETKPDLTPVTDADRAVEAAVRETIAAERPGDVVLGEEYGSAEGARRWIVDPIDGTRNFSRGIPVWATLLALEVDGSVQLGVVSAPALGRRWHAERGQGAWSGADRLHVSSVRSLEDAVLSLPLESPVRSLAASAWHARGYGDFWSHMLVAEGAVDGTVDAVGVSVWDLAPLQVIVEEAGGRFSDYAGVSRIDGGTAVSTNGHLHDVLLAAATGAADA